MPTRDHSDPLSRQPPVLRDGVAVRVCVAMWPWAAATTCVCVLIKCKKQTGDSSWWLLCKFASFYPRNREKGRVRTAVAQRISSVHSVEVVGCVCCCSRPTVSSVRGRGDSAQCGGTFPLFFVCAWVRGFFFWITPPLKSSLGLCTAGILSKIYVDVAVIRIGVCLVLIVCATYPPPLKLCLAPQLFTFLFFIANTFVGYQGGKVEPAFSTVPPAIMAWRFFTCCLTDFRTGLLWRTFRRPRHDNPMLSLGKSSEVGYHASFNRNHVTDPYHLPTSPRISSVPCHVPRIMPENDNNFS